MDAVRRAIEFYASIGKKPIHLRKEVVGHVANRLQAAIYREVVNLINLGVVDVADADTAVCWGPGFAGESWGRVCSSIWAAARAAFSISWSIFPVPWRVVEGPGAFTEWPEGSKETIAAGVIKAANGRCIDELAQMRDEVLLELVKLRASSGVDSSACEVGRSLCVSRFPAS